MKIFSKLMSFSLLFLLTACSSCQIKKQCENTNWFEYGQSISEKGQYLEEDDFVKQCKEYEIYDFVKTDLGFKSGREKLCNYPRIEELGTLGEKVNFKFCDGLSMNKMLDHHKKGLQSFCVQQVGYSYGSSGKVYQEVCSKEQELVFLPAYLGGRKEFLGKEKKRLQDSLFRLRQDIQSLNRSELNLQSDYNLISHIQDCKTKKIYNQQSLKDEMKLVCEEPDYIKNRKQSLQSQLNSLRSEISSNQRKLEANEQSLEKIEIELNKIPSSIP